MVQVDSPVVGEHARTCPCAEVGRAEKIPFIVVTPGVPRADVLVKGCRTTSLTPHIVMRYRKDASAPTCPSPRMCPTSTMWPYVDSAASRPRPRNVFDAF